MTPISGRSERDHNLPARVVITLALRQKEQPRLPLIRAVAGSRACRRELCSDGVKDPALSHCLLKPAGPYASCL